MTSMLDEQSQTGMPHHPSKRKKNDMRHELEVFSQRAKASDGRRGFTPMQRKKITDKLIEFGYKKPTTDDKEIIHCGESDCEALGYIVLNRVEQLLALHGVSWVNVFFSK